MWLSLFAHVPPISFDPLSPCQVSYKPGAKSHAALKSDNVAVSCMLPICMSICLGLTGTVPADGHGSPLSSTLETTEAALNILMLFLTCWVGDHLRVKRRTSRAKFVCLLMHVFQTPEKNNASNLTQEKPGTVFMMCSDLSADISVIRTSHPPCNTSVLYLCTPLPLCERQLCGGCESTHTHHQSLSAAWHSHLSVHVTAAWWRRPSLRSVWLHLLLNVTSPEHSREMGKDDTFAFSEAPLGSIKSRAQQQHSFEIGQK